MLIGKRHLRSEDDVLFIDEPSILSETAYIEVRRLPDS